MYHIMHYCIWRSLDHYFVLKLLSSQIEIKYVKKTDYITVKKYRKGRVRIVDCVYNGKKKKKKNTRKN